MVFLTHECRGIATDLAGARAQINISVTVEREATGTEFMEIRFLPINKHVDDIFHEHDLIDFIAEDFCFFLFALFFIASHRIAEALYVIEYLVVVAHISMNIAQLLEYNVVPNGDDVPVFIPLSSGIVVPNAPFGDQNRGRDLKYLI